MDLQTLILFFAIFSQIPYRAPIEPVQDPLQPPQPSQPFIFCNTSPPCLTSHETFVWTIGCRWNPLRHTNAIWRVARQKGRHVFYISGLPGTSFRKCPLQRYCGTTMITPQSSHHKNVQTLVIVPQSLHYNDCEVYTPFLCIHKHLYVSLSMQQRERDG